MLSLPSPPKRALLLALWVAAAPFTPALLAQRYSLDYHPDLQQQPLPPLSSQTPDQGGFPRQASPDQVAPAAKRGPFRSFISSVSSGISGLFRSGHNEPVVNAYAQPYPSQAGGGYPYQQAPAPPPQPRQPQAPPSPQLQQVTPRPTQTTPAPRLASTPPTPSPETGTRPATPPAPTPEPSPEPAPTTTTPPAPEPFASDRTEGQPQGPELTPAEDSIPAPQPQDAPSTPAPQESEAPASADDSSRQEGGTGDDAETLPGPSEEGQDTGSAEEDTGVSPTPPANSDGTTYLIATPADKPGYVISPYPPYNTLDVRGLKAGSLALDPTINRIFRLP